MHKEYLNFTFVVFYIRKKNVLANIVIIKRSQIKDGLKYFFTLFCHLIFSPCVITVSQTHFVLVRDGYNINYGKMQVKCSFKLEYVIMLDVLGLSGPPWVLCYKHLATEKDHFVLICLSVHMCVCLSGSHNIWESPFSGSCTL